jgi:hypothetical protein
MRHLLFVLMALGSSVLLSAQTWSAWSPDPVFKGIEIRERCGGFNEFASAYVWDVQLRNTYQKDIDLSWTAETQPATAQSVKAGAVVDARHIAPKDCSAGILVNVNDVKNATAATVAKTSSFVPKIEGRWTSKDPEPLRKQLAVQLNGKIVTTIFSSPGFSFQISTKIPEGLINSVKLGPADK